MGDQKDTIKLPKLQVNQITQQLPHEVTVYNNLDCQHKLMMNLPSWGTQSYKDGLNLLSKYLICYTLSGCSGKN